MDMPEELNSLPEHTPGPWEAVKGLVEDDEMRCGVVAVRGKTQFLVATIENGAPGDCCDTEWANAQMMAASLAMNEALDAIDALLTDEIAARSLAEGSELHSLLVVPRNIARAALRARRAWPRSLGRAPSREP
jgi:hypothetical protein